MQPRILTSFAAAAVILAGWTTAFGQSFRPVQPSFSPDMKRLVFVAESGGLMGSGATRDIRVVNVDGTGMIRVAGTENAMNPRFSPDGKKIVFSRWDTPRTNSDIWIINSDGTGLKQVTQTADRNETQPDFGESSDEIIFVRRELAKESMGAGIAMSLAAGKDFELLPKSLNIQRIFIADNTSFYITCACKVESTKSQLAPGVSPTVFGVFKMSADGTAKQLTLAASTFANLDSVRNLRMSHVASKYAYDILFQPIKPPGDVGQAKTGFFIVEGPRPLELSNWLISDFDISWDGSKMIVSGYPDGKPPQRLWTYDLKTASWSEIKPVP